MYKFAKYFFVFWFFAFLLFAYWQLNDPDPEIWAPVYICAALFSALAVKGKHPLIPLSIAIIACVIGAIYFYPDSVSEWVNYELEQQDLTMKTKESEEARETFGLLIVALVLSFSAFVGWKKTRNP
ncbi:transmembrane 220 family protein [Mongoliibacter ruber]|uniref:Transmembrane family 220 protein n=1 Tax=Mongoliibacter ruber TaxID=1750599 RepID=A0A2T0WE52_9BACT|nr:transmembrane 220 family protein [Mongoliibacter ruber]PRY84987.1 transmembrane family 220 protein [Mongoliibacter ruber]